MAQQSHPILLDAVFGRRSSRGQPVSASTNRRGVAAHSVVAQGRRRRWRAAQPALRHGLSWMLAACLACPPSWAAPPPAANGGESSRQSARDAYERGIELVKQGQLVEALAEFERAYERSPEHAVLYNIGAVSLELEQWARARRAFELYLKLGAGKLSEERVTEVQEYLNETSRHTATLTLIVNVPGPDVLVNGSKVEPTTMSGLILESGQHVVRVSKDGFQPVERVVSAASGENVELVMPLTPLAPSAEPGTAGARPAARSAPGARLEPVDAAAAGGGTPLWVPWALTGALAAGWLTTAALAVKARHDRDLIEQPSTSAARIDSARRLHLTLAIVSDVLLASTLASAGVSAYLTWWSEPAPDPAMGTLPPPAGDDRALRWPSRLVLNVSGDF